MALSRQLQLQKIKELDLEDNTHKRIDCLFCGKTKTLSITKRGGFLLWHCFSASCNVRGSTEEALSLDQLKDVLSNTVDNQEEEKSFTLPEYFIEARRSQDAMKYLKKYNCIEGYHKYPERFYYDITMHRAVFTLVYNDEIVGAVGLALNPSQQPKWWRYDSS